MIAKRAVQAHNLSRRALALMMTCMSSVVISANRLRHDEEAETALTADRSECRNSTQGTRAMDQKQAKPYVASGLTCLFLKGRNEEKALTDYCHYYHHRQTNIPGSLGRSIVISVAQEVGSCSGSKQAEPHVRRA